MNHKQRIKSRYQQALLMSGKIIAEYGYKLEIMQPKHKQAVADISSYQFSENGGQIHRLVIGMPLKTTINRYDEMIDYHIQCGTSYVIIECKHNQVVAFHLGVDFTEIPRDASWNLLLPAKHMYDYSEYKNNLMEEKYIRCRETINTALMTSKWVQKYYINQENFDKLKYGECFFITMGAGKLYFA